MRITSPDSKVHWANIGPIWGRQDPGGPHVGPMNFAIWDQYGKHRNPAIVGEWKPMKVVANNVFTQQYTKIIYHTILQIYLQITDWNFSYHF